MPFFEQQSLLKNCRSKKGVKQCLGGLKCSQNAKNKNKKKLKVSFNAIFNTHFANLVSKLNISHRTSYNFLSVWIINCLSKVVLFLGSWLARENSRHLATLSLVSPPNDGWELNERRNSILMTRHFPDLGSAFDWSCRVRNLIQPIRSTTLIWVVTCHQYGISALVSQTSFGGESSGSVAKCRLFSHASSWHPKSPETYSTHK